MRICRKCNSLREDDMIFCPECGVKYVTYDNQVYAAPECPVVIVEQNLILEDGNMSGAVIFGNIGEKRIAACAVRIRCSDQFGDPLSDMIVKYSDLSVDKDETFGDEKVFSITAPDTRRIQIIPEKILFDDGSMQSCENVVFSRTDAFEHFKDLIENAVNQTIEDEANKAKDEETLRKSVEIFNKLNEVNSIYNAMPLEERKTDIFLPILKEIDNMPELIIPETIDYIDIPNIGSKRDKNQRLRSIRFLGTKPPKVLKLSQCNGLETATIPDGWDRVPRCAFLACTSLKEVVLPDTIREIEDGAFSGCYELRKIVIPSSVKKIGSSCFRECRNLKELVIPDSVEEISYNAFEGSGIEKLYCPDKIINKGFYKENFFTGDKTYKKLNPPYGCKARVFSNSVYYRQKRVELYWSKHAKEKQQLESERDTLYAEIKQLQTQLIPHERKIGDWKRKCEADTPAQYELRNVEKQISSLRQKYSQLGIFKGKEKKALQAQIDELDGRISAINQSIEAEKKEQIRMSNAKIREIEQTMQPIKEQIAAAQKRIYDIFTELTRDR